MEYSLIFITLIAVFIAFCYYRKSRKKNNDNVTTCVETKTEEEVVDKEVEQIVKQERYFRTSHDLSRQCIRLLGGFTVKDKNGEDISNLFTPMLRALLVMLILFSAETHEGVSGDTIARTLWPDKNKFDARNNRNVSLTKLRGILQRVGQVSITNKDNHWNIVFGEDVLCDYSEIKAYYQEIKENGIKDEFRLNILLNLLYPGSLLYHTDLEWLDEYKGRFSYHTIEMLTALLNDSTIKNSEFRLKIANTLLQHDYINEKALRIQCNLLYRMGRTEQTKACYNEFCTNHSNLLGIRYNTTLQEILGTQFI